MTFSTVFFNGYDKNEVDNYLEVLMEELAASRERLREAEQWLSERDALRKDYETLKTRCARMEEKLKRNER